MQLDPALPAPPKEGARTILRPLATSTYLLRNAGKTIPLTLVIMLAVLLIAGIVSLINSIPYSIRTIYAYSKYSLAVSPRGDMTATPALKKTVQEEAPVPIDRIIVCRATGTTVKSIVGKWPFVVLGMKQDDLRYYLSRIGADQVKGRLPRAGEPEALISEPVARNLGLRIGSELQGPENTESYSPYSVKVVGISETPLWLMLTSIEYQQVNHFPPIDNLVVFADTPANQKKLDLWAEDRFKGERAQVFAFHMLEKDTNEMFSILYQILNVVIGTLVAVITFMMGMLMNIYQTQRLVEFGLLQALGYTKRQLLRRVMLESVAVVLLGWILGVFAAYGGLLVAKAILMDPRAFALDPLDQKAYLYTMPIPLAILSAALFTVWLRFRSFDPVGVVERRLV